MTDTFALQLAKFAEKAEGNARQVVRHISIDILSRIVVRTPVGNPDNWESKRAPAGYVGGRLRANWHVTIGAANTTVTHTIDKSGQPTIDRGVAAVQAADGEQPIYIINSLPYAIPVEYGHS